MPVVRLSIERIEKLVGRRFQYDELESYLMRLKSECNRSDGYVDVEINSDRPDLMISEGVARSLKGLLELELGLPRYRYEDYDKIYLNVERVDSRPYILMAVIRNLDSDEEFLRELIQFQEKLHATIGRNRRKVAIGIHDLSKLAGGECVYKYVSIEERMIPLHRESYMRISDVLRETEQGVLYGKIALERDLHPAIICGGEIISLPPVINSDITRLESGTRDILIDVTGVDLEAVEKTLEILTTTLAENSRERSIGRIYVDSRWGGRYYPQGRTGTLDIERGYIASVTGVELGEGEIIESLRRARFDVERLDRGLYRVLIPSYRIDILHKIDLVEEIVISYGLDRVEPEYISTTRRGRLRSETILIRRIRDILTGLGFTEIMSYILSSKELYEKLSWKNYVEVANPVSKEFSIVRSSMLPSILRILYEVQNESKPIKIYEVGEYVTIDPSSYTGTRTRLGLAMALMDYEMSFEEIHSMIFSLFRYLGLDIKISRSCNENIFREEIDLLIEGRRGFVKIGDKCVGLLGETHPRVLEILRIKYPIVVSFIDLDRVLEIK